MRNVHMIRIDHLGDADATADQQSDAEVEAELVVEVERR